MLRRTESIVFNEDTDTMAASPRPAVRRGLSALRPETVAEAPAPAPEPEPSLSQWREDEPLTAAQLEHRRNIERWRAEVLQSVSQSDTDDNDPGRLRQLLRPRNIALILVALVAGGTAAFLALQPPSQPTAPIVVAQTTAPAPAPEIVKEPMVQVLVAKSIIGIGQRLSTETVEWVEWPEGHVGAEFITQAAVPEALTGIEGAVARYEFFPGEPIRETKLARSAEGLLSAVLEPGTRAVAVNVTAESASGGFILPNDRVDVVLTKSAQEGRAQASETILGNIRVLAINSQLGGQSAPAKDGKSGDSDKQGEGEEEGGPVTFATALATLALDPQQAEVVINATMSGRLSLVLRPIADIAQASNTSNELTANQAIRMTSPFWAR